MDEVNPVELRGTEAAGKQAPHLLTAGSKGPRKKLRFQMLDVWKRAEVTLQCPMLLFEVQTSQSVSPHEFSSRGDKGAHKAKPHGEANRIMPAPVPATCLVRRASHLRAQCRDARWYGLGIRVCASWIPGQEPRDGKGQVFESLTA